MLLLTVFKKIEAAIKQVAYAKTQTDNEEELALLDEEMAALKEISNFIKEGKWLKKSTAVDRLLYTLRHGVPKAAEYFGCTKENLRSTLTNYSKKLEGIIGSDTIDIILNGNPQGGLMQFYFGSNIFSVDKILMNAASEYMPAPKYNPDFRVSDCINEIKLLRICSDAYMKSVLERINMDKLSYILYVLTENNSDEDISVLRQELYKYLVSKEGNIDALKRVILDRDKAGYE